MIQRTSVLIILLSLNRRYADAARTISLDRVGYRPQSAKFVFVSSTADSFRVFDAARNSVRFVA